MREDIKRLLDQAKRNAEPIQKAVEELDIKTKPVASTKVVVKPVTNQKKTKVVTGGK